MQPRTFQNPWRTNGATFQILFVAIAAAAVALAATAIAAAVVSHFCVT